MDIDKVVRCIEDEDFSNILGVWTEEPFDITIDDIKNKLSEFQSPYESANSDSDRVWDIVVTVMRVSPIIGSIYGDPKGYNEFGLGIVDLRAVIKKMINNTRTMESLMPHEPGTLYSDVDCRRDIVLHSIISYVFYRADEYYAKGEE